MTQRPIPPEEEFTPEELQPWHYIKDLPGVVLGSWIDCEETSDGGATIALLEDGTRRESARADVFLTDGWTLIELNGSAGVFEEGKKYEIIIREADWDDPEYRPLYEIMGGE